MMINKLFAGIVLSLGIVLGALLPISNAFADKGYISGTMRVGVRTLPVLDSTPVKVLKTGDSFEILESSSGFLKIKTEDGTEGWIRSIYSISEPPAVIQLQTELTEKEILTKKLNELQTEHAELIKVRDQLQTEQDTAIKQIQDLKQELYSSHGPLRSSFPSWLIWLIILVLFSVGAFVGGVAWNRIQTAKRLGGLRL